MRIAFFTLLLIAFGSRAFAGEIVVYNQKWTRKETPASDLGTAGQGYILLDLENLRVTRISTGKALNSGKVYQVEKYTETVFSEPSRSTAVTFLAVQGSLNRVETYVQWQQSIFLKGKETLLSIGPSQQKQVPKVITGIRRMSESGIDGDQIQEESFSATFDAKVTTDTNGNSRTLDQEVQLLITSLKEAGYQMR